MGFTVMELALLKTCHNWHHCWTVSRRMQQWRHCRQDGLQYRVRKLLEEDHGYSANVPVLASHATTHKNTLASGFRYETKTQQREEIKCNLSVISGVHVRIKKNNKEIKGPVKLSLPCNVQLSFGPTYKKIKCNHSGLRARGTQYALTKRGRHCTSQDHHARHNHWRTKINSMLAWRKVQLAAQSRLECAQHIRQLKDKYSWSLVVFLNIKKYKNNYVLKKLNKKRTGKRLLQFLFISRICTHKKKKKKKSK